MDILNFKNKVLLFKGNLWIIDDIIDDVVIMSKLESGAEYIEIEIKSLIESNIDFEQSRLDAINVMNQTRYFDNVLSKENDNIIM
jgi:hypothetical protein